MMDRVQRMFGLNSLFRKTEVQREPAPVSHIDAYLNCFYSILMFEDTTITLTVFTMVHLIFLVIVAFEIKVCCVLFCVLTGILILDMCKDHIKISQNNISYQQIIDNAKKFHGFYKDFKRENPSVLCGIMITFFGVLNIIGRAISGDVLAYLLFLIIFFAPYLISIVPKQYKDNIKDLFSCFKNVEGVADENDLTPYLHLQGDLDYDLDSLLTERTQDSATNSLVSGISSMPSYMEGDYKVEEIEEDDLLPYPRCQNPAVEFSSDSDSEEHALQFNGAHFKNSSSEDDENLEKTRVSVQNMQQELSLLCSKFAGNVMHNLTAVNSVSHKSDSESDFEIINEDDIEET